MGIRSRVYLQQGKVIAKPYTGIFFQGFRFMTVPQLVFPPQERIDKLRALILIFFTRQRFPARMWQSLPGLMLATERLGPLGRLRMRPLQFCPTGTVVTRRGLSRQAFRARPRVMGSTRLVDSGAESTGRLPIQATSTGSSMVHRCFIGGAGRSSRLSGGCR